MGTLRDATAALDEACDEELGDEITYTPDGGSASTFHAWVEFQSNTLSSGGSSATAETVIIEVPMSRVAVPAKADRITMALRPGVTYQWASKESDETGKRWRLELKKVVDA